MPAVKPEDCWKVLQQINEWIRFADAKAVAILAASGLLGGLVVKSIPAHQELFRHPVRTLLLAFAMICVGSSSLIAIRTVAPRLRAGETRSLVYFEHIARRYANDRNAFVDNFLGLGSDDVLARQAAEQVWANSIVARRKFRRVAYAMWLLAFAMIGSGLAVAVGRLWDW